MAIDLLPDTTEIMTFCPNGMKQGVPMDVPLDTTYGFGALGVGETPDTSRVVTEEHSVEIENPAFRSTDQTKQTKALLTDYTFSVVFHDDVWIATANRRGTSDTVSVCFAGNYTAGDAAIAGITKLKELLND